MSKWGKISFFVCGLSVIVLFTARLLLQGWIDYLYFPFILSVVAFAGAIFVDHRFYLEFLTMRTTKHGLNMGGLILLALILTVAINYLGVRFDKNFDFTKEKINSLSEQSIDIVKNLKDELKVMIFFKGQQFKDRAREIKEDFRLYEAASSKIKVEVLDANYNVELAKRYLENNEAFAAIVEYQGRRSLIKSSGGMPDRPVFQESDITSSLVKITRDKQLLVSFITGHGEKDIDGTALEGLKFFAEYLRNDGYTVANINLLAGDKIPDPPAVLAIVGPKTAYTDKELAEIREYMKKGGRLFLAIDPGERHNLALLTKPLGIEFKNNFVLNEVAGTDEGLVGAVGVLFDESSAITDKLSQSRSLAVFPIASELSRATEAPASAVFHDLIKSHPAAYQSNSLSANTSNPERRVHNLAMSVKNENQSTVVFGDSDFLSDVRINQFAHMDLAINSIAYLFDDESNITIRPKNFEATKLEVTQTKGLLIALAGLSLPLGLIVLSGVLWFRRKNL